LASDTTSTIDEPAATDAESDAAGSTHSATPPAAPSLWGDVGRALLVALLVASSVGSPGGAVIVAPFIPVLVAIRMLRTRVGARRFLLLASVLSLGAAVAVSPDEPTLAWGLAIAVLLVPGLGLVHAQAALRDPVLDTEHVEWPEPRLWSGMSVAVIGWIVAVSLAALVAAPYVESPKEFGRDVVRESFAVYTRECAKGGVLERQTSTCEEMLRNRDQARDLVDERALELIAAFLGAFVFGAALTAHPIVISRTWRVAPRVRPPWRLRELEVHWSAAYLVAGAIGAWLLAPGESVGEQVARFAGVFAGTIGALLIVAQGMGLLVWLLTRRPTPGWYRAFLILSAILFWPVAVLLLFLLGVLDMAVHPRRRVAAAPPTG
jgi:hypothetical protein